MEWNGAAFSMNSVVHLGRMSLFHWKFTRWIRDFHFFYEYQDSYE